MNTPDSVYRGRIYDYNTSSYDENEGTILDVSNGATVELKSKRIFYTYDKNKNIQLEKNGNVFKIAYLNLHDDGIVDLTKSEELGSGLFIHTKLDGENGKINLKIAASKNNERDYVWVKDHAGLHFVTLKNVSNEVNENIVGTKLIYVKNEENGEFRANDVEGTLYWNKYTLAKDTSNPNYKAVWKIVEAKKTDDPTTITSSVNKLAKLNNKLFDILSNDYLQNRLGIIKITENKDKHVWIKTNISKNNNRNPLNDIMYYEVGYDNKFKEDKNGISYTGIQLHYSRDRSLNATKLNQKSDSYGLKLYYTKYNNNGLYYEILGRLSNITNKYGFIFKDEEIVGKYNNIGLSISGEIGNKINITKKFVLEPEIQGIFSYERGGKYTLSNGIYVNQSSISSFTGRFGLRSIYELDDDFKVYVKSNLYGKLSSDMKIEFIDKKHIKKEKTNLNNLWGRIWNRNFI